MRKLGMSKKSYISSLIIFSLFSILLINMINGFVINSYIKNYKEYDGLVINKLGQIRGEIQRFTKLKISGFEADEVAKTIEKNFENVCQLVENNSDIVPSNYKVEFFSKFHSLKDVWKKIKECNNTYKMILFSEKSWRVADKLTTFMQEIAQNKIKFISQRLYIITVISSFIIVLLIFFVYFKIREGLERASITDNLTNLYNRMYFNEISKYLVEKNKRDKTKFSMVIFDIDNFKQINDTYGHQIGDDVLRKVGEVILANIRKTDFAFRYGGEEFVILFPQTELSDAISIIDRIQKELAKNIQLEGKPVTISGGIGEYTGKVYFKDFIKILDNALYQAKRSGKNRIISVA